MITPLSVRKIELLAPAKDALIAKEAILHGADAVYIGAPKFSARSAAGVSLEEIGEVVNFAHQFNAKVYVALNTIVFDDEIEEALKIAYSLYDLGVDALIVQDFSFFELDLPPIPLHASTQMDNRTAEKVRLLENLGCEQVVLARELSATEIGEIARKTSAVLEVFVHGALCVSYSGQCYASQAYCRRSANRGACAQLCRLPYTLEDAAGHALVKDKHLLSLKDLNRSSDLEMLLDAGVSSFKIEGRLKDLSYVKNVTAYYRKALDAILEKRSNEFARSSDGVSEYTFTPNLSKSFNRGFSRYFLNDRVKNLTSPNTPKSIGEKVGSVMKSEREFFTLKTSCQFANGDGLCYLSETGELEGLRLNRIEGERFYPSKREMLPIGTTVYRNYDKAFDDQLQKQSAKRTIGIAFCLRPYGSGVALDVTDDTGCSVTVACEVEKESAKNNQVEQQTRVLTKLGDTVYRVTGLDLTSCGELFLPASLLTSLRRDAVSALERSRRMRRVVNYRKKESGHPIFFKEQSLSYTANVANRYSREFYKRCGIDAIAPAFELKEEGGEVLMTTKYCLLYEMGKCKKENKKKGFFSEPLFLRHAYGRMRIEFDCRACEMRLYKED